MLHYPLTFFKMLLPQFWALTILPRSLEEILLWPVNAESLLYFLRRAGRFPAV